MLTKMMRRRDVRNQQMLPLQLQQLQAKDQVRANPPRNQHAKTILLTTDALVVDNALSSTHLRLEDA